MLGVEQASIDISEENGQHRMSVGDSTEIAVEDVVPFGVEDGTPARLDHIAHPAGTTLTVARATTSRVSLFGLEFAAEGKSAFSAPFSWSG